MSATRERTFLQVTIRTSLPTNPVLLVFTHSFRPQEAERPRTVTSVRTIVGLTLGNSVGRKTLRISRTHQVVITTLCRQGSKNVLRAVCRCRPTTPGQKL